MGATQVHLRGGPRLGFSLDFRGLSQGLFGDAGTGDVLYQLSSPPGSTLNCRVILGSPCATDEPGCDRKPAQQGPVIHQGHVGSAAIWTLGHGHARRHREAWVFQPESFVAPGPVDLSTLGKGDCITVLIERSAEAGVLGSLGCTLSDPIIRHLLLGFRVSTADAPLPPPPPVLEVVRLGPEQQSSPDRPWGLPGHREEIPVGEYRLHTERQLHLGREGDVRLTSNRVSRNQAILREFEGNVAVQAVSEVSGTWLNGTKLQAGDWAFLETDRAALRVGDEDLLLKLKRPY